MHLIKQFISDLKVCSSEVSASSSRGHATREKLLQAGLTLFGERGFDGVSSRELATLAGTPVSAITYHFSTMDALYLAVITQMLAQMAQRLEPGMQSISEQVEQGTLSPQAAIEQVTAQLVDEIVCCQDKPEWPMLMIREHLSPGPAFDLIYNGAMLGVHGLLCELFAAVRAMKATDPAIELAAFAHMGQVLSFRIFAESVKRRMGWAEINHAVLAPITRAVAFRP